MSDLENYAKMCKGAKKIQEGWKQRIGDCYFEKGKYFIVKDIGKMNAWEDCVWLPSQDQLQGMVIDSKNDVRSLFENFSYVIDDYGIAFEKLDSAKELWLAYVMEEKYGKFWNCRKEKWINTMKGK